METHPGALKGAVTARAFEAGDEPRVLEILQAAFGRWHPDTPGLTPGEFFRWKHNAGPHGPSILLVAEVDGVIIAFAAYMPWRFTARGQTLAAMRGVDLATHPSHRGLGASIVIRSVVDFPDEVAFVWSNPNEQSRPGSLKSGRRQIGRLPRFIRPRGPLRETIRRARAKGSKTPERLQIDAPTAAEILRDGVPLPPPLPRAGKSGDRLATVKDLDYLRWRYGHLGDYRALAGREDRGGGLAIFRTRRHGPFWVTHLCELFLEREDPRSLRALLRLVGQAAPVDFLSCNFPSRRQAALCGFAPLRRGTMLMAYPLRENLLPDPTRLDSWALSVGDLELL
ncbi:MAG TPA: GNAT family N-acetyltransferase [Solirubrobacteraceae bacterium]|jgi:hypothetical protein|nr:GNAT family N-acetyltransferase [Solirubrobacteraceae bacterium]